MFSKDKNKSRLDPEQHQLLETAQNRIKQKKRLYSHFVIFLIGSVFLILINKILKYGENYDWFVWAITLWAFLFVLHAFNVFVTQKFLGVEWERRQREKLVELQKERIAALQKEIETEFPLSKINKKKRLMQTITMIAAIGENNELGKDNDLLWHLPDDFKRFKQLTTGHYIIMGRKTFESFPKPLPNRTHIIVTRNKEYKNDHPSCMVTHSIEKALELSTPDHAPYIIGGGEIYKQGEPYAHKMDITRVHGSFEADTFFPEIDENTWKLVASEYHPKDDRHKYAFTYLTYSRK